MSLEEKERKRRERYESDKREREEREKRTANRLLGSKSTRYDRKKKEKSSSQLERVKSR